MYLLESCNIPWRTHIFILCLHIMRCPWTPEFTIPDFSSDPNIKLQEYSNEQDPWHTEMSQDYEELNLS